MVAAVAPVGQRPVDVDADGVDGRGRPQRIEVEIDVAVPSPGWWPKYSDQSAA